MNKGKGDGSGFEREKKEQRLKEKKKGTRIKGYHNRLINFNPMEINIYIYIREKLKEKIK